jgi:hypothetical protein
MKNKGVLVLLYLMALGFLALATPLFAHHGNSAYDYDKTVTIKGTVTDWTFANPHSWLKMDVKDDQGKIQHWVLEGYGAGPATAEGWRKNSLKQGEEVTVDIMPTKASQPVGRIRRVIRADGSILNGVRTSTKNDVATPTKSARPQEVH